MVRFAPIPVMRTPRAAFRTQTWPLTLRPAEMGGSGRSAFWPSTREVGHPKPIPTRAQFLAVRLAKAFHEDYLVKAKRESWPYVPF
jgi:hypothetical protein